MDSNKGMIGLALGSWLVALAGGTLAGTLLWVLGENWSFLQGAFVGFLVFLIFGGIISFVMTRPLPGPGEVKLNTPATPPSPPAKPEAPASKAAAPVAAAAPAAVKAAEKPATAKAPAAKSPAKQATPSKAAAGKTDARPALMQDAPEGGQADDLKKITGVGPKLEQTLNDLGIWHYEQVAKLKKKDIAWVDERLRFKGRIERDDWVGQAKALAKAKG